MPPESSNEPAKFLGVLKQFPEYRKLWSAQLVNNIGNQFTYLALQFLVYSLTQSTVAMGILAICQTLPMITIGPYIGVLVDRYDRKKIMTRSNLAQAVLLFCIPLTRFLPQRVYWIYGLAFLLGTTTRFFFPSRGASIPKLVSKETLLPANSLSAATYQITLLIGPMAAGFLVARMGYDIAFYIDMLGFLISAFFIQKITTDLRPDRQHSLADSNLTELSSAERTSVGSDLKVAYRFLQGYSAMSYVIILFAVLLFGFGSSMILTIPFLNELTTPFPAEEAFGIMSSLAAATGLTVAVILGRKNRLSWPLTLLTSACILAGIMMIGFSFAPDFYTLAFFWTFFGMLQVFAMIPFQTLAQETIPDALRGKIFSLFNLVITSTQISGMALGGFLADSFGIRTTYLINGTMVGVASVIGLLILVMKHFERDVRRRRQEFLSQT